MEKTMDFAENWKEGSGLASVLLTQYLITMLIMHGVLSREMMLEVIDQSQMKAEEMQGSHVGLEGPARAARLLLELTRRTIQTTPPRGET
jgi:hypothetical protein